MRREASVVVELMLNAARPCFLPPPSLDPNLATTTCAALATSTPVFFSLPQRATASNSKRNPQQANSNADLCQDPDWQDHHARGGAKRQHRERQGQDPGQGGYPPRPAAPDLCWQAAGGWPHTERLQHPEGEHSPPGVAPAWRLMCDV